MYLSTFAYKRYLSALSRRNQEGHRLRLAEDTPGPLVVPFCARYRAQPQLPLPLTILHPLPATARIP